MTDTIKIIEQYTKIIDQYTKLSNDIDKLKNFPFNITKDLNKDYKKSIDNIKYDAKNLFDICNQTSNKMQEIIENNCKHEFERDYSYYDPCRSYRVCKNCHKVI